LRWINAAHAELVQKPIMDRSQKYQSVDSSPDHVSNMAAMTARIGVSTVPAAWPQGVSQLAQAIEACQRCDTAVVCTDWLRRAPSSFDLPPAFCPNRTIFKAVKPGK
jgi:hypothetical protein